MKMLFTKYVCDVCGKEINPDDGRHMVAFGIGDWEHDENLTNCTAVTKDMCRSCYDTLRSLVGELKVEKPKEEPVKKTVRGDYDADRVVELWKIGWTCKEIVANVGCTTAQANYAIAKARKNGEVRNKVLRMEEAMSKKKQPVVETVVDESGLVVEIRRTE